MYILNLFDDEAPILCTFFNSKCDYEWCKHFKNTFTFLNGIHLNISLKTQHMHHVCMHYIPSINFTTCYSSSSALYVSCHFVRLSDPIMPTTSISYTCEINTPFQYSHNYATGWPYHAHWKWDIYIYFDLQHPLLIILISNSISTLKETDQILYTVVS